MIFLLIFPNLKFGEFSLIFIVMTGMMMQVKFRFMGQDIVKRSTDSIINRFFFFETKLREDLDRRLQEEIILLHCFRETCINIKIKGHSSKFYK